MAKVLSKFLCITEKTNFVGFFAYLVDLIYLITVSLE